MNYQFVISCGVRTNDRFYKSFTTFNPAPFFSQFYSVVKILCILQRAFVFYQYVEVRESLLQTKKI